MYCLRRLQQIEPSSNITSYTNSSLAAVTVTGIDLRKCNRRAGQGRAVMPVAAVVQGLQPHLLPPFGPESGQPSCWIPERLCPLQRACMGRGVGC